MHPQRVELFADGAGAQVGAHRGGAGAGDDEHRDDGADLVDRADRRAGARVVGGAELDEQDVEREDRQDRERESTASAWARAIREATNQDRSRNSRHANGGLNMKTKVSIENAKNPPTARSGLTATVFSSMSGSLRSLLAVMRTGTPRPAWVPTLPAGLAKGMLGGGYE